MCLLLSIFWQHLQSITEDAWQHIYLLTHNTWHSRANACQSLSLFYQHGRTSVFILLLDVSLFHCRLPPPSPTPFQYSPLTFHQVFKSVYPVHNEGEFSWPWTRNNDSGMNLKLTLQSNSNMEYKICDDLISHLSSVPAKNFKRVIWSDYTSVLCVKDDDIISDKELLVLDLVCWCDLHKFWTISYSCFNEKLSPPYI